MASDDNPLGWGGGGRPAALAELLKRPAGDAGRKEEPEASPGQLQPLPRPGDPYEPFAAMRGQHLPSVHFLIGTAIEGFAYADLRRMRMLDGDDPGQGPVILLYFVSIVPMEVRLEGRQLDQLYDQLSQHRIRWVREYPQGKGFAGAGTVVTRILPKLITSFPKE